MTTALPPGRSTRWISRTAAGCVGRVMQHAVRVDEIERVVWEIEAFGVSDAESAGQVKQFEAPFCEIDGGVSQIDAGVVWLRLWQTGRRQFRVHNLLPARVDSFDCAKPAAAGICHSFLYRCSSTSSIKPARTGRRIGKLRPAGMFLPKRAHTFFEFGILF